MFRGLTHVGLVVADLGQRAEAHCVALLPMVSYISILLELVVFTIQTVLAMRLAEHTTHHASVPVPAFRVPRGTSWHLPNWVICDTGNRNPTLARHGYSAEYIEEQLREKVNPSPDLERPVPVPSVLGKPMPPPSAYSFSKVWRAEIKQSGLPDLTLILGEIPEGRAKSIHLYLAYVNLSGRVVEECSGSKLPPE